MLSHRVLEKNTLTRNLLSIMLQQIIKDLSQISKKDLRNSKENQIKHIRA